MTRIVHLWRAAVIWIGIAGAVVSLWVVAGVAMESAGPALETRMFPVVRRWEAVATRLPTGETVLAVRGEKTRPECAYIPQSESMVVAPPGDGDGYEVQMTYLDDPTPGSSRPGGRQSFGRWLIATPIWAPAGSRIYGVVQHRCHAGRSTITPIGGPGFLVPPLPSQE